MQMCEKKYDFSIVMSVFNSEKFIDEAIESIINQDYGFDRIQLILVDDGSTDHSAEICDNYAIKYPDNIVVIHKENGGPSSARNAGIKLAQGEYVNFSDPDDYLSSNTISEVAAFFKNFYDQTDVVAIPNFMFGDR